MSSEEGEFELIGKAASGDRNALGQLLLNHCNRLSSHISRKVSTELRSPISVEDILQQTLVRAVRNIDRFEPRSERAFFAWLAALADSQLQDSLRALRRRKRGGGRRQATRPQDAENSSIADLVDLLSDRRDTPCRSAARREAIHAVQVGIAGLPDDQREAVQLRFLRGQSLDEAATAMGRTPNAVRSLIHRAKQRLRGALGNSSRWFERKR